MVTRPRVVAIGRKSRNSEKGSLKDPGTEDLPKTEAIPGNRDSLLFLVPPPPGLVPRNKGTVASRASGGEAQSPWPQRLLTADRAEGTLRKDPPASRPPAQVQGNKEFEACGTLQINYNSKEKLLRCC